MLHSIYFSAKGTTKLCAEHISRKLDMQTVSHDWFSQPCTESLELAAGDVLLFSMPVYGGFIPQSCTNMAMNLHGNCTPAIIVAVYGNRHYDDALLQMKDILTQRGFFVVAAGAFLAEHSVFPSVAAGRPDERDREAMENFALKCGQLLRENKPGKWQGIRLPGTPGYDGLSFEGLPFKPDGDERCIGCGDCVKVCPQRAITAGNPQKTNETLCINCGACIKVCPVKARNYHSEMYETVRVDFENLCREYRVPETFFNERR